MLHLLHQMPLFVRDFNEKFRHSVLPTPSLASLPPNEANNSL